mgnify:CR=1 FL=1
MRAAHARAASLVAAARSAFAAFFFSCQALFVFGLGGEGKLTGLAGNDLVKVSGQTLHGAMGRGAFKD